MSAGKRTPISLMFMRKLEAERRGDLKLIDSPAAPSSLHRPAIDHVTRAGLRLAMAVPFLYFGTQLVAAPYFPDYSFVRQAASLLGSNLSTHPSIFNVGAIATGLATLFAAPGFFVAFHRLGANRILAWITCVALVGSGISSAWAGYFPLPDPRHSGHPALLIAMISLPFLFTATLWKERDAWLLKTYLVATIVLLVVMIPIMSGATGLDTHSYSGLLQRIFALTVFPPIAVCAFFLAIRVNSSSR
jgi:hypothetical membrane protein